MTNGNKRKKNSEKNFVLIVARNWVNGRQSFVLHRVPQHTIIFIEIEKKDTLFFKKYRYKYYLFFLFIKSYLLVLLYTLQNRTLQNRTLQNRTLHFVGMDTVPTFCGYGLNLSCKISLHHSYINVFNVFI
jgi:hypothetical protein